jgi:hypothetical protein
LTKLREDLKGKAVVDLVDHDKLQMKRDVSARGMVEEMLTMQFLVSIPHFVFFPFHIHFLSNTLLFRLQGFLRSTLLYCYFCKVSVFNDGVEDLKKRLEEAEGENAKLKEVVAKKEEDLQLLGQHSALMECKACNASKARDRVEAGLSKLSEEFTRLGSLSIRQEDHSILNEELGQLEEKHTETLEQLKES